MGSIATSLITNGEWSPDSNVTEELSYCFVLRLARYGFVRAENSIRPLTSFQKQEMSTRARIPLTVAMVTFPLVPLMESPVTSSMSPLSPFVMADVPRDIFPLALEPPLESAARPLFNTISPLRAE